MIISRSSNRSRGNCSSTSNRSGGGSSNSRMLDIKGGVPFRQSSSVLAFMERQEPDAAPTRRFLQEGDPCPRCESGQAAGRMYTTQQTQQQPNNNHVFNLLMCS